MQNFGVLQYNLLGSAGFYYEFLVGIVVVTKARLDDALLPTTRYNPVLDALEAVHVHLNQPTLFPTRILYPIFSEIALRAQRSSAYRTFCVWLSLNCFRHQFELFSV
jgi:hypothetical protein